MRCDLNDDVFYFDVCDRHRMMTGCCERHIVLGGVDADGEVGNVKSRPRKGDF